MPKKRPNRKKSKKKNPYQNTSKQTVIRTNEDAKQFARNFAENMLQENQSNPAESMEKILRDYNNKLIENGYGMSRDELTKMNLFDIRSIMNETDNNYSLSTVKITNEINEWSDNVEWYQTLPCFTDGVVQFNTDRYIQYNVESLNVEKRNFVLNLKDYLQTDADIWEIGTQMSVLVNCENESFDANVIVDNDHPYYGYPQLYKLIPIKTMKNWTLQDRKNWNIIVKYAENFQKSTPAETQKALFLTFIQAIIVINYYLSLNKPSRPVIPRHNKRVVTKEISTAPDKSESEKVIRKVGIIKIQSAKPPKIVTKDTVIHYKTTSWTRRATIRTLKSGKKVFVKASTCYRQCLKDKNTNAKAKTVTIQITDKTK